MVGKEWKKLKVFIGILVRLAATLTMAWFWPLPAEESFWAGAIVMLIVWVPYWPKRQPAKRKPLQLSSTKPEARHGRLWEGK